MTNYKFVSDTTGGIGSIVCVAVSENWKLNEDDNTADFLKIEFEEDRLKDNLEVEISCHLLVIKYINQETEICPIMGET